MSEPGSTRRITTRGAVALGVGCACSQLRELPRAGLGQLGGLKHLEVALAGEVAGALMVDWIKRLRRWFVHFLSEQRTVPEEDYGMSAQ